MKEFVQAVLTEFKVIHVLVNNGALQSVHLYIYQEHVERSYSNRPLSPFLLPFRIPEPSHERF